MQQSDIKPDVATALLRPSSTFEKHHLQSPDQIFERQEQGYQNIELK